MKAAAGFLLQVLDSCSSRRQLYVLLRNLRITSVNGVGRLASEPLAQIAGQFRLQAAGIDSGLDPAQNVEPVCVRLRQDAGLAFDDRLVVERNPESRRVAVDAVAEKSGRRDADNRDGVVLDIKRGA